MSEKKDDSKKIRIQQGIAGSIGLALILGAATYNGYLEGVRLRKQNSNPTPNNEPAISTTTTYIDTQDSYQYTEPDENEQLER